MYHFWNIWVILLKLPSANLQRYIIIYIYVTLVNLGHGNENRINKFNLPSITIIWYDYTILWGSMFLVFFITTVNKIKHQFDCTFLLNA